MNTYSRALLSAAIFCFIGTNVIAQQKLDFAQSWGQKPSLTTRVNQYPGWANAQSYLERDATDGRLYQVDVKTGKRQLYNVPPAEGLSVYVENNDIYLKSGEEKAIQLTHSPDVPEQNPTLSPDGKQVAFTRKNNLYSLVIASGKEVQYTSDGTDVIYNGWSSWVYYEEILGRATNYKAFWWSPDSRKIAFMRFDDTKVPMFPIYSAKGQHGYLEETRYPKAGDPNPTVRVGIVEAGVSAKVVWADFNEQDDQYFGQPYWAFDSKTVMVQWMNRDQNNLKFYQVDPGNGTKKQIYDEHQSSWINLDHEERITYLKDNKYYILKSDKTGWAHYYLYKLDGTLINPITSGDWQVSEIKQIDEKNKVIYFTARKENSARLDLYRVSYTGKDFKRLTFGAYSHDVTVSPDGKYFVTRYSNVTTPDRIALVDNSGKVIREIADSKSPDFERYRYGKTEYLHIKSDDGLFDLPLIITYPTDFDENKVYPVVFSIYGGPDAGTVKDTWKGTSNQYWSNEGIIQVTADHRASGQFGKAGVAYMYRNLGHWEIIDYSTVVKWLKAKPWVAKNKVLITGHSYGGYMTCLAMTKAADVFDFGIAGAPVTSWDLYDSHYTERWMDTPKDNPDGYKAGSVLTYTDNYKGVLRIMHGDMDDNVHLQNTIQLVDKLTDRSIPFELMIYPGSRHGFDRSKSRYDFNERVRFYYQYLLEKPVPNEFK